MALNFELFRPDDLLALQVQALNLKLDATDPRKPVLVIENAAKPAYLVVTFPPQAIAEKAYFEVAPNVGSDPSSGNALLDAAGSVPVSMAGGSRLVFKLGAGVKQIPFQAAALLDWSKFELVVSPAALGTPNPPPLVAPTALQTALELPYRVILSPAKGVGWAHAASPQTHAGRTELWHTRLAKMLTVKTKSGTRQELQEASDTNTLPLRAVWSPDFIDHGILPGPLDPGPFLTSMTPRDRAEAVILTAGASGYYIDAEASGTAAWIPMPFQASRLFLSALGGWLSGRGSWPLRPSYKPNVSGPSPQVVEMSEWVHLATQGRDHYVRIVDEGYLYPFGHLAALITVTERKIVPADGGVVTAPTAYLKQHDYIVVREREKNYGSVPYLYQKREMPFWQSVRILTTVTPDIDEPSPIADGTGQPASFWIQVGGVGFPFHMRATDLAGSTINFLAQLIFVGSAEPNPAAVQQEYRGADSQRVCPVKGQRIAYADPTAGDTALKTSELYFDTELLQSAPPFTDMPFVPFLDQAAVTVPALEQLLGTTSPVTIELYSSYLQNGLDSNAGVFADLTSTPLPLTFSTSQAGGFATPKLTMTALSARKGVIAGNANDAAAGKINPSQFFGDISAELFGTIPLQNLIPVVNGVANAAQNAPEIRSRLEPNSKSPTSQVTHIQWSPQLQDYGPVKFNGNGPSALTLSATINRNLAGGAPTSAVKGSLTNFVINLLGVVDISISAIHFNSSNGQKTNVTATLPAKGPIKFVGPLAFIQTLADVLPPGIFGGAGPSIDLQPTQLRVSYTLGLPPLSIGVFSLENISITTALDLPYLDGKPGFEFAFASRNSPFLLTIECLGGGGFFHMVLNADGIQMVEGALEFGGHFSLDLGVASGSVQIMAGIYFQLKSNYADLTGFVDVSGEVSVLGIISISLDLNLSLSYQDSGGKKMVEGRATLTVSVHVLFFSASVQISMEKSFGSSPGDPRIQDVLTAQDWQVYAAAFA